MAGNRALDLLPEGVVARGGEVGVHGDVGGKALLGAGLGPPAQESTKTVDWVVILHWLGLAHTMDNVWMYQAVQSRRRASTKVFVLNMIGTNCMRIRRSLVDGVVAAGEGLEVADVLEHF